MDTVLVPLCFVHELWILCKESLKHKYLKLHVYKIFDKFDKEPVQNY
jgi:hypothetical protein